MQWCWSSQATTPNWPFQTSTQDVIHTVKYHSTENKALKLWLHLNLLCWNVKKNTCHLGKSTSGELNSMTVHNAFSLSLLSKIFFPSGENKEGPFYSLLLCPTFTLWKCTLWKVNKKAPGKKRMLQRRATTLTAATVATKQSK